jgi:hypothetical protein
MVGMSIGISPARHGSNHGVMVGEPGQLQVTSRLELVRRCTRGASTASHIRWREVVGEIVLSHHLKRLLENLPQLDGLVVGREKVMGGVLSPAPLNLIDFLLNLQRLQVVELGFVGLELRVELVLASFFL